MNVSEEELNAFIDDQLGSAEQARVLDAVNRDAGLQRRVAEMRQTQSMLRHAYETPPLPRRKVAAPVAWGGQMLAASLLLAVGMASGWMLHNLGARGFAQSTQAAATLKGVVIPVSRNDPAEWAVALANARNVRKAYRDKDVNVEIVAYGPGLKMLRNDSPVSEGLEAAQRDGVQLLACGDTMRTTHTSRQDLNWLVDVVPAGIVEILQKQSEGYAYLRP